MVHDDFRVDSLFIFDYRKSRRPVLCRDSIPELVLFTDKLK